MSEETIEQEGIKSVIPEASEHRVVGTPIGEPAPITEEVPVETPVISQPGAGDGREAATASHAHEGHSPDTMARYARSQGVLPRTSVSRESDLREQPWKPAPILPVPDKREGIDHRWVRSSMRGQSDNINVSQALRDGWVPVLSADYQELQIINDRNSQFPENVEVGGLLLCARPTEIGDRIRLHAEAEVRGQMEAVDRNYFREESARMPMLEAERRTRASKFGDD